MPDPTRKTISAPGIFTDFDVAAYHADCCPAPSLNQSLVKVILDQSVGHAKCEHPRLKVDAQSVDEPTEKYDAAKAIGNAAHLLLIGRGKKLKVFDAPNWNATGMGKGAKTQLLEDRDRAIADGFEPILQKHHDRALQMADRAREQLNQANWLEDFRVGDGEVVVAWQEDGFWFRSLIDWRLTTILTDYKSTGMSVAPHVLGRLAVDAGWDIQAAFQERGLDVLDPEGAGRRRFRFFAQENYPPYAGVPVELTEAWLTMGRKKVAMAVDAWKDAMSSSSWPLYPPGVQRPEYPGWHESQWLNREITEAARQRVPIADDHLMAG